MGTQGYRSDYLAAFHSANDQLESIYSEYHDLQRRKESLESALMALEPFLRSAPAYAAEVHTPEPAWSEPAPTYSEPYSVPQPAPEPVLHVERYVEPVAPPAFTSVAAEEELDPLQLRINRALGLAVA